MSPPTAALAAGAADYRQVADQILGESRFHPPPLPRPLHGVLDALGRALAPVARAITDAFDAIAGILPGGSTALWALIAAAVVGLVVVVTARMTDRALFVGAGAGPGRTAAAPGETPLTARALEAAAEAAERRGDYGQAIRLRFQAGLLRLDELGAVTYSPSLANAAVARRLGSPTFDALARRFEEIAYGGRTPDPAEALGAREDWRRVLDLAARR